MQIGIGIPIPLRANLPGQQGGEENLVSLSYESSSFCSDVGLKTATASPQPTVSNPFSVTGSGFLDLNTATGVINTNSSTPGSYVVTYNPGGGIGSATASVTIEQAVTVSIVGGPTIQACQGIATVLTTSSTHANSFQWYDGSGEIPGETGSTFTPSVASLGSSTYYVIATNANGTCSKQSANVTFTVNEVPVASISASSTTICTGDSVTLTANQTPSIGNYTYQWTSPSSTSRSITVSPSSNTTYEVVITNSDTGCVSATASQAITVSSAPTVIASIDNDYTMSFNGNDQYVDTSATLSQLGFPATTTSEGSFTVSFWYNSTTHVNFAPIIWSATNYNLNDGFGVSQSTDFSSTKLRFWVGNYSSSSNRVYTDTGLNTGQWYHIVAVFTGGSTYSLQTYVNGVPGASVTGTNSHNINSSTGSVHIGYSGGSRNEYFNGSLDEVAIWDTSLSSCDIEGIYNATTSVNGQPKSANLLDANTTIPAPVYWNRMGD